MAMAMTRRLRELIARPGPFMAPGAADALTARLVAKHGFEAIYMTGAGTTAVRLGMPDVGLLTMTEMADNAQRIAEAARLPLIADADTGYGGPVNVQRTVRAYERAGAAGIHIEDQQWPKRCGHLAGKALIPVEEMVAKIRAGLDARSDPDFVLIARTDALAVEGFERALERCRRYEEAGADVLFVEAPSKMDELAAIPRAFGRPVLYNMASSGKTPFLPLDEIGRLGFKIVIYPNFGLLAAINAIDRTFAELKRTGSIAAAAKAGASFQEFFDLVGMREVQDAEAKYGVDEKARVRY
ncbi:MAG: isocitrate lyase/PEP mutase family protein [Burkholderiales bacterium]